MRRRRVVITGTGATTALGSTASATFDALCGGRTAIDAWPSWGSRGPVAMAPGGDDRRTTTLALTAVDEALKGLDDRRTLAIIGASTSGDMQAGEQAWSQQLGADSLDYPLAFIWGQLCHGPTQAVRAHVGARGPCWTISNACTSGATAVSHAADLVRSGEVPAALAFGADALCRTTSHGFASLSAHARTACQPFDRDRSGMSLGEGAGALLLEDAEHALAYGRRPLAELVGAGASSDSWRLTAPEPSGRGARAAILAALGDHAAADVGYVCAHATGTPLNDAMEGAVLDALLPGAAVSGIKGAVGHTLGAAGALEAMVTVHALSEGRLPPTVGLSNPENPDLDLVRTCRPAPDLRLALSVNFAFGGSNSALLFARWGSA